MGRKSKKDKKKKKEEDLELEDAILENEEKEPILAQGVAKSIVAVVLIMLAIIVILSLFNMAGVMGGYINNYLGIAFGWGRYLLPLVMIILGILYFRKLRPARYILATVGAIIFFVMFLGLGHIFNDLKEMLEVAKSGHGCGYVGYGMAYPLTKYLGKVAGAVVLNSFSIIGAILLFNVSVQMFYEKMKEGLELRKLQKQEIKDSTESSEIEESESELENGNEEDSVDLISEQDVDTEDLIKKEVQEEIDDCDENIKSITFDDGEVIEKSESNNKAQEISGEVLALNERSVIAKKWEFPSLEIFEKNKNRPHQSNLNKNVDIIQKTFSDFGIEVTPDEYHVGPTVTQFTFKPAVGVKISKILALQNDLSLALAVYPIRIEAPIPGRSLIGIEVPNRAKSMVRIRTMLESEVFKKRSTNLSFVLGEDVNGRAILANIEKMPHLMIAGSTGTGKSVGINVILSTLLYASSPDDLKLILVDPKRVELSAYNGIPHLLTPVITESAKVVNSLKWAISEMERRYKLLQKVGSRNIHSYNNRVKKESRVIVDGEAEELEKMSFILIVIDELADLMASHGKEVEGLIVRLAQMARAVGIHLIVSTQRPSVEVLTGLIKANITTRIAFQVATQIDSRTILDMAGADKLLGNGDLLYLSADSAKPKRIQGVYVSEKETRDLVEFIKQQAKSKSFDEDGELAEALDEQLNDSVTGSLSGDSAREGGDDELYEQAKDLVVKSKKASTSMLQRRLRIGYSRAARIIDMLEENGVVSSADGSKPRQVLLNNPEAQKSETEFDDDLVDQAKRDKWQV